MNDDLACQSVKAVGLDSLFSVLKKTTKRFLFLLVFFFFLLYKMVDSLLL